MITVLFFAQVRELTGVERLSIEAEFTSVEALRQALAPGKLLAVVNQSLVTMDHPLAAGDEVAFFPPVTGGMEATLIEVGEGDFDVAALCMPGCPPAITMAR